MLRQQALLTINNLPSIIARLTTSANSHKPEAAWPAPPRKKGTPPSVKSAAAAAAGRAAERDDALDDVGEEEEEEELDEETDNEIKEIERIGKEIERVLLRIGSSQEPLADKDLLALKRLRVIGQATLYATQAEANKLATEATTAIKVRVAGLKGTPPKSRALSGQKKK